MKHQTATIGANAQVDRFLIGRDADLVEILIEHGRQQEAIITQMGDAVAANDKDKVFELAKQLVDNGSITENSCRPA